MKPREVIETRRNELKERKDQWLKSNPNWESQESIKTVASKVEQGTFTGYRSILPIFFEWVGKQPDQVLREREKELASKK